MPFTPAHVAAVLPLVSSPTIRRWLDPWALALGAMVPDLPIFLPFLPERTDWHSLQGVLTLDLLSVLVLLGLFHGVFREPLIALLPPSLGGRAAVLKPSFRVLPIVAGAVVGSATHVFWDSFTHSTASMYWGWSGFDHRVLDVIPLFRALQYGSSVVGLAIVVWWVWRGLARMPAAAVPDRLVISRGVRAGVLAACAVGILVGAVVWPMVDEPEYPGIASMLTKVGAGTVVGLSLVLLCYALVWQVRRVVAVFEGA
ncbi:DUF4184 family protein [Nonomuraea sp. NPDC050556]|uniref:DUF4184 family protein n=1 Tax=Nonomuraea sp. NPDC050556 TaxID=3364369 RepID=UPI0037A90766